MWRGNRVQQNRGDTDDNQQYEYNVELSSGLRLIAGHHIINFLPRFASLVQCLLYTPNHIARDNDLLNLAGAFVKAEQADIAIKSFYSIF